jgi:cellulose synthase/poly-beta-1,6-N-acetylglucosamine synthase-like glycosyltransferase
LIVALWLAIFSVFAGSYASYFLYLRFQARKPWGLKIDSQFRPRVTILIPARNEEKTIQRKLENAAQVSYPREKIEVILIDDESTDQTLTKAQDFASKHPDLPLKILSQCPRKGKACALNKGLQASTNDVIIVSDADAFWSATILEKVLPYLSDPTVGALSGRQTPESQTQSWVTQAEKGYLDFMSTWRLGESKVHSTIRFEGVFCAFKKEAFKEFDSESGADDSGTALRVVQNRFRAILVPEASVPSEVSSVLKDRTSAKIRRATQLTGLWFQCLTLLLKGRLLLPKKIAVPEIFLSIFAPFVFVALIPLTIILFLLNPIMLIPFILILGGLSLIPRTRSLLAQGIMDQLTLFYSVILHARKKRFTSW